MKNRTREQIKKWSPLLAIAILFLVILNFLIGPRLWVTYKKKRLKNINVMLITLDTLRADFVGAYGKNMADTPNIDNIAAEGVLFETCISQTPLTLPSHTTILSGTYPLYHQVRDNGGFQVPDSLELISETLKKNGYTTAAFIGSYVLHSEWGMNQGFDIYSDEFDLSKYDRISLGNVQKRADEVLGNAKTWLKANNNKKWFTWIHLYDPHTPYDPPSPFKERFASRPYRGEVEYLDEQLGFFFQFLKDEGIYDRVLIIMAADHGESLGQHGEETHGFFIYEPTVRVPLIIRAPFQFAIHRVTHPVELVDIAPSILSAVGIPIPSSYQGLSFIGEILDNEKPAKTTAYTETYFPRFHFGWSDLKAFYSNDTWKYIMSPKPEFYNIGKDLEEKKNLVLEKSYEASKARREMDKFMRRESLNARMPGNTKSLDKDAMEKLAALGYLTTTVDTTGKTDLPDPKGKAHIFNALTRAKDLMGQEKFDEAISSLKNILADEPGLVDGILQLGNAYSKVQKYEEALACFYEVLQQKPDYNAAMLNITGTLERLGRFDKGIQEAQRFLKTFPNDHTLLNELGNLYFITGEYDKALAILGRSLEVENTNPTALNRIAAIHIAEKNYKEAHSFIDRAYRINPFLRGLHYNMAQVEEGEGNAQKAIEYYKIELELHPKDYKSAYNLAEDLRKAGQLQEAITYYRVTMQNNPHFNIPYFMIAKYYLDRKENLDEAFQLCMKGIELKPQNKYTVLGYYILSDIFSGKGEKSKSDAFFSKGESLKRDLIKKNQWN